MSPCGPTAHDPERGIREFVVGMGSKSQYEPTLANGEAHNGDTYSVLKLILYSKVYDRRFVPTEGETLTESGHGWCH